jgi:hypothetical protein
MPRARIAVAAVAAAVVLVGGSAVATEAIDSSPARSAAAPALHGLVMRTGTFETASGRVAGQIVVYGGHPSWVFMNIDGSSYDGPVMCRLQGDNGSIVAVGDFAIHGATGMFSRTVPVNIGGLRGAKLVTPAGTVVASATFS